GRNPNPSPTAQRASPAGIEATTAQQYRSLSVCLALSLVSFRPQRVCNSPPRDDHPLASRGVPVVLARAVTQTGWQAENLGRAAQSHRRDEPCKSPLGCTCPFRKSHPAWESHRRVESSHDRERCSRSFIRSQCSSLTSSSPAPA